MAVLSKDFLKLMELLVDAEMKNVQRHKYTGNFYSECNCGHDIGYENV